MRAPLLRGSRGPWLSNLLACGILLAAMIISAHFAAHGAYAAAAAPLLLGPIKPFGKAYQTLASLSRPSAPDQPESIPWVLYDTQTYAQAGSATLTFFKNATQANASDPTLSNFASGQLDAGYYFEIHRMHTLIGILPSVNAAAAVAGAANDMEILHKTARGVVSWSYKGKPYGPVPLAYFGRPGGPVGSFTAYGTAAAETLSLGEHENNGGFPVLGNVILAPATQFSATLSFNATAVAQNGIPITMAMMGVLHRPLA